MRYVEFLHRQWNAKVRRLRDVHICSIKTNGFDWDYIINKHASARSKQMVLMGLHCQSINNHASPVDVNISVISWVLPLHSEWFNSNKIRLMKYVWRCVDWTNWTNDDEIPLCFDSTNLHLSPQLDRVRWVGFEWFQEHTLVDSRPPLL